MIIFRTKSELARFASETRRSGKVIGLVPTMGYLHEGHLSLIAEAKRRGADEIAVSVFVNPTQFGPNEDFAKYPRDEKADRAKCRKAGATAMFFPTPENMYAPDHSVWVDEEGALSGSLCGARRPGHFRGVCTVVAKLFNLACPHLAVFGRKDFQQAAIIRRMVRDLDFGIDIVVAPIVREASGLAMSSRNTYLSDAERESALALSRSLKTVKAGAWAPQARRIRQTLEQSGLKPDYVEAVDSNTLKPVKKIAAGVTVLLAAYSGKTRLIDNAEFTGGRMVL